MGDTVEVKVDKSTGEVSAEGVVKLDPATLQQAVSSASSEASILFDTMDTTSVTTTTTSISATATATNKPALPVSLESGPPERYVEMFRLIAQRNAALVADWLRVGYVQGI